MTELTELILNAIKNEVEEVTQYDREAPSSTREIRYMEALLILMRVEAVIREWEYQEKGK